MPRVQMPAQGWAVSNARAESGERTKARVQGLGEDELRPRLEHTGLRERAHELAAVVTVFSLVL